MELKTREDRRKRENKAMRIAVDLAADQGGGHVVSVTEMPDLPGYRPGDSSCFKITIKTPEGVFENFMLAKIGDE